MVLTAYFVLSLVNRAFLPPSPAQCASIAANLISASGYQDHTTSPSASDSIVNCRHLRPPHPALHVRDDRDTPLFDSEAGQPESILLFLANSEAKYFLRRGWTRASRGAH
jgi:hypothetical protein